ncbi:glycosyltransferase [Flavobacterium sp. DG1-102-2]|uniref:glycosyltransferase n=1 Tax=Flavobacterium sp. DG1-102-2 TaxID=3081663 RepID=UPI002948F454|nr:glycosyltransferase [Flavobacterium sp. DG1-102-2]MDV6168394.1 glycosyltransferase [Flavobacterium sp. DG1-102-2]
MPKDTIAISAINFFEGGPLSVLKDCLGYINSSRFASKYTFIALVHKKELFDEADYPNIRFLEFSKSRTSYAYRLYYEYIYFGRFAKENNVAFWFSLHDMTPSVGRIPQAVYCHNPSPFNKINFSDLYIQPTQFLFRLFYKFLYRINIKKNKYVIVQQLWMKNRFVEMFDLQSNKVVVSPPQISPVPDRFLESEKSNDSNVDTFFFPTFPRPFKNIEVICEAAILAAQKNNKFKIIITVDGSENKYSQTICNKYRNLKNIEFIGLIKREEVYRYYSLSDCLIFPSKLETWGLPISEFKQFNKPIFASDLPYAKEAVGKYDKVRFFDPENPIELSNLILEFVEESIVYDRTEAIDYNEPYVKGWDELFNLMLK